MQCFQVVAFFSFLMNNSPLFSSWVSAEIIQKHPHPTTLFSCWSWALENEKAPTRTVHWIPWAARIFSHRASQASWTTKLHWSSVHIKINFHVKIVKYRNPFYSHTHLSHILLCVTHFTVTIHFDEKHHFLVELVHLLVAQNICKAFKKKVNVTIRQKIYDKY